MSTQTKWRIPFFVNVSEENFIKEIRALGFYNLASDEILFNGSDLIRLKPLKSNGGNSSGFRLLYEGDRLNDCRVVLQLLLSLYPEAQVTGLECIVQNTTQRDCINLAEKAGYVRCSMYGLYTNGHVGVVCMPQELVLHVRKKGIRKKHIEEILMDMESTKDTLLGQKYNLFTILEEEGGLMLA